MNFSSIAGRNICELTVSQRDIYELTVLNTLNWSLQLGKKNADNIQGFENYMVKCHNKECNQISHGIALIFSCSNAKWWRLPNLSVLCLIWIIHRILHQLLYFSIKLVNLRGSSFSGHWRVENNHSSDEYTVASSELFSALCHIPHMWGLLFA